VATADRTRVEVANPHHDAAMARAAAVAKPEFLSPKQRRNYDIPPVFQLAVRFDDDARAQVVEDEGLMRFGQPHFPGNAGVLDAGLGRAPVPPSWPTDQDHVRVPLWQPCGDRADADLRHQFDTDAA